MPSCSKSIGWKNEITSPSYIQQQVQVEQKNNSVGVFSFLHDMFSSELSASTDRYILPVVSEPRELDIPRTAFEGDAYGSFFYFLDTEDFRVFRLDLETGEVTVFTDEVENPRLVCTDSDGVYVYDYGAKEVIYFDFEGNRTASVPIPVEPHGGDGYDSKFYAVSLDHYDGLLLLAVRDGLWTLADGGKEWKQTDLVLLVHEKIARSVIVSRSRLLVYIECMTPQGTVQDRLIGIDTDGKNETVLSKDSNQEIAINENRVFRVSARGCRLYEINGDNEIYIRGLSGEGHKFHLASHIAVSGNSLLIFWHASGRVTLLPLYEFDTVRILAPESERERADTMVNASSRVSAQYQTYDDESYIEKLAASLLSGSDDFEIALVKGKAEDVTTLLTSVLTNRQYVDLNQNGTLKDHLDAAYPGIREMLDVNGKTAVIPILFEQVFYGFNTTAQNSFALPPSAWTAEDLAAFGDTVRGSGYSIFADDVSQNAKAVLSMATAAVQANADMLKDNIGAEAEAALNDLFTNLEKLRTDGCLFSSAPLFESVGQGVFEPYGVTAESLNTSLALLPAAVSHTPRADPKSKPITTGKQPLTVVEFLFVNPNSERADLALQFLAEMTSEENRYNADIWGSPLWPGLTEYYRNVEVYFDPETEEFTISPHREPAIQNVPPAYIEKLDEFLPDYYAASELCFTSLTPRARQAARNFALGALSGEECAKILYEEFVYKLKG